jgi:hypothetical protein
MFYEEDSLTLDMKASKNRFADSHRVAIKNESKMLRQNKSTPTGNSGKFGERGILHINRGLDTVKVLT